MDRSTALGGKPVERVVNLIFHSLFRAPFKDRALTFVWGMCFTLAPILMGSIEVRHWDNSAPEQVDDRKVPEHHPVFGSGMPLPPVDRQQPVLLGPVPSAQELPPQNWQDEVQKAIAKSEYNITFQEQANAYQSPNRAQDLRITYRSDGFRMTPRVEDTAWSVDLALEYIGRAGHRYDPEPSASITTENETLIADHGDFAMEYRNTEEGMRQNFRVQRKPSGSGPLEVLLQATTDLTAVDKGANAILFCKPNSETGALDGQVWYKDLAVSDAHGEELVATMRSDNGAIVMTVQDANATYPILIDPLSTTASWIGESNSVDASFGLDVHSAGDVNGDGYSDVIVGAPSWDNGSTNEGAAFVFLGSASGLAAGFSWSREANQASASYGICVATAGDANGDGFSDVVVGAHLYDSGQTDEGVAFVYFGSAGGLGNAVGTLQANVADSEFGFAVACAGDVNGDGYSDVVVGAPETDEAFVNEGKVYVYHGAAGASFSATADWTVRSNVANNHLGFSVTSAGDCNADGYSDIIMGEPSYSNPEVWEGRALAFRGSASGLVSGVWWSAESNQASASMGNSVSWAGDVDGDGFGDVIVGANVFDNGETNEGAAFIFNGYAGGITSAYSWMGESDQAQASFGVEVSGAGDVNGDGFADVIVGAHLYDAGLDAGAAFVYYGSGTGPSSVASWSQTGSAVIQRYGYGVATAGDVNGDGYSDVIVGAFWADNGETDEGRAFVFHGAPSGLGTSSASRQVAQNNANFGFSVASAGDLNADGYCDVIVGAPLYDNGQTDEGRVFVYLNSASGLALTSSWSTESNQTSARYGTTVASAGDVNGDGYSDALIAAPYFDNGQTNEGRAYLFSGSSSGLGATAAWTSESDQADAQLGLSLGSASDVNGDGYMDVIIGIPLWDNGQTDEGRAVVHFGSAAGLAATPGWSTESNQAGAQFGLSVASAGDVYTDGYGDVVVGAPLYDNGQTDEGRVFVYYGTPTGPAPFITWSAESNQASAQFGISVSTAGDVNGDGKPDLIIGANLFDNGEINEGRAFVYHGSGSGLPAGPNWTTENNFASSQLGYNVSSAGDVNGDGYGDVLVSAHLLGNGRTHNYLGSATGLNTVPAWTSVGSQAGEQHGTSASGAGDVDGDGFGDVIVGAPLYDAFSFPSTYSNGGRAQVYFGNLGNTLSRTTKQYRSNSTTPVQPGNGTFDNACTFVIGQIARSWMGRRKAKIAWQIRTHAPPFSGNPLANSVGSTGQSATWTAINSSLGVEIKQLVTVATSSFPRWRVRVRHEPATMIDGQVYGRWYYFGIHDEQDGSVKTDFPTCGLLPVELTSFTGYCEEGKAMLEWTTASEQNSDHFILERSEDLRTWIAIDRISAAGYSQGPISYTLTDAAPLASRSYYRLTQVDMDGTAHSQGQITVDGCLHSNGTLNVYPNPTNGLLNITLHEAGMDGVGAIEVHDATGQLLLRSTISIADREGRGTVDLSALGSGVYFISAPGIAGSDRVAVFKD